jgi:cell fate regulator YaaT (PSP1 superfamily)
MPMALMTGVIFKKNDMVHYFDPAGIRVEVGDKVICHLEGALEIGEVTVPILEVKEQDITSPLKKIVRKATYYDLSVDDLNSSREQEGFKKFDEFSRDHNMAMKLVDVHVMFDKSKMVFFFTAEKRVDFRDMVKQLASHFKIRIELRQIGVRDEAKIIGGLGPCGRDLCCKSFLTDFESISIKMAKDQNLPLNPLKISGICGRLMCCLRYEYGAYQEFLEKAPELGAKVKSAHGVGIVCGYEPLKDSLVLYLKNSNKKSVPLSEVEVTGEKVELDEFGEPFDVDYVKAQEDSEDNMGTDIDADKNSGKDREQKSRGLYGKSEKGNGNNPGKDRRKK